METGASSIITLIKERTPHILFDTNGDVFEGKFKFTVLVGLANHLKVKPFEFTFNLTLKPCVVQSIRADSITIYGLNGNADIKIPEFS